MAGLIDKIVSHECIPLFYTDMVGINSMITEDKKELAFELANIMVSEEVLTGASRPAKDDDPTAEPRRLAFYWEA